MLELIVVLSVLIALSAILVPSIGSVMEDSKVSQLAVLYDTLKEASARHNFDTGRFAIEYSGSNYVASSYHDLAMEQSYAGWKGPYIEEPVNSKHNPWKGNLHLYRNLLVNGLTGWDLDRDGTYEVTAQGDACVLWLQNVPEGSAEELDEALDTGVGDGVDWRTAGRIQWSGGTMWMLVFQNT